MRDEGCVVVVRYVRFPLRELCRLYTPEAYVKYETANGIKF